MPDKKDLQLASDLRTVITRLVKKLRKKSAAGENLSLTERSTLALLDQHTELLPNELAAMEKITTQSMSQILAHLLELGYINRKTSETDKRKAIISLSASGKAILFQIRNERDEWLFRALKLSCPPEDLDLLKKAVTALERVVEVE